MKLNFAVITVVALLLTEKSTASPQQSEIQSNYHKAPAPHRYYSERVEPVTLEADAAVALPTNSPMLRDMEARLLGCSNAIDKWIAQSSAVFLDISLELEINVVSQLVQSGCDSVGREISGMEIAAMVSYAPAVLLRIKEIVVFTILNEYETAASQLRMQYIFEIEQISNHIEQLDFRFLVLAGRINECDALRIKVLCAFRWLNNASQTFASQGDGGNTSYRRTAKYYATLNQLRGLLRSVNMEYETGSLEFYLVMKPIQNRYFCILYGCTESYMERADLTKNCWRQITKFIDDDAAAYIALQTEQRLINTQKEQLFDQLQEKWYGVASVDLVLATAAAWRNH